jgi:hypothetical protein
MTRTAITLLVLGLMGVTFIFPGRTQTGDIGTQVATRVAEPRHSQRTWGILGTLDERLVASDNGTIIDSGTGLEWFVGPDKDTTWDEANNWVISLSVDGGGWRLPKRDELKTLYVEGDGKSNPIPLFQTTGWFVWTSETMSSGRLSYAWGFSFAIGDEYWPVCTHSDAARAFAVRSAEMTAGRVHNKPIVSDHDKPVVPNRGKDSIDI